MFEKVPNHFWMIAVIALLIGGPLIFFSFWFGGATAGAVALVAVCLFFVVLYMLAVRWYT
jgi:hypothetical protein